MSVLATFMKFEPMRRIEFGSIGASYVIIGIPAIPAVRQFIICNRTNVDLNFSFDGIIDHLVVPSNTIFIDDVCSNKTSGSGHLFLGKGVGCWVKDQGVAPSSGYVTFSTMYGSEHASSSQS